MKKTAKRRNAGILTYALVGIALLGIWKGTNMINGRLKALPVKSMPQLEAKAATQDALGLFPVWIKQGPMVKRDQIAGATIDDVFRKKEEPKKEEPSTKPVEPPEVDYTMVLRAMAVLDSVADNGAVLNGQFYPVGAEIEPLRVPRLRGLPMVPRLQAVDGGQATLLIGTRTVVLPLGNPA